MQQLSNSNFQEDNVKLPDARWLFRSVVEKLPIANPNEQLQGAWISVNVRHGRDDLIRTFEGLDPDRLHFAIIATSETHGYVLGRTPEIQREVTNFFRLTHDDCAVV